MPKTAIAVLEFSGDRLRAARQAAGLSRDELAEAAFYSEQAIRKFEQGGMFPPPLGIRRIAQALGLEYADLIDDGDDAA